VAQLKWDGALILKMRPVVKGWIAKRIDVEKRVEKHEASSLFGAIQLATRALRDAVLFKKGVFK
jgi:hypothetical protein